MANGDVVKSGTLSNKKVAAVNAKGKFTAKRKSKVNITVTLKSGKKNVVKVTVK